LFVCLFVCLFVDGLYLQPSTHDTGIITSPEFSYSEGVNIHFKYSIRRAVGEKLVIKLHNRLTNEVKDLWSWANYAAYGQFDGKFTVRII
jgi:hypothetical protein